MTPRTEPEKGSEAAVSRRRALLWDFDGTLAARHGLWSGSLIEVLDELDPGHTTSRDDLRPALAGGFPWHSPDDPHPHLNDPRAWWDHLRPVFARGFRSVGYASATADELASQVRSRFLDPGRWEVFDDVRPTLEALRSRGWRHVVVSNHVPELADLVAGLGLADLVDEVVTSALVGYDKPHPGIFEAAVRAAGHPATVWMIGDNPVADVAGAEAVGIPAILVRRDGDAVRRSPDLYGVPALLPG